MRFIFICMTVNFVLHFDAILVSFDRINCKDLDITPNTPEKNYLEP